MEARIQKGDIVRVDYVDMYGFCGRDRHPNRNDINVTGEVVRVERFDEDEYTVLTVLTFESEPRFLDLIDYEVSAFRALTT